MRGEDGKAAAIEEIADVLQSANAQELAALEMALAELMAEDKAGAARKDMIKFYEEFFVLGW